jgi:hypothetical protein
VASITLNKVTVTSSNPHPLSCADMSNKNYKFSFVNLIDFCCSFLFFDISIFMPLFFISSFLKEKLNYQHSFVYKISKHNYNQISICSYILEYFFIFVNVIIKLPQKIIYEEKVQLLKDKSLS